MAALDALQVELFDEQGDRGLAAGGVQAHGVAGWLVRLVPVQALAAAAVVVRRVDESAHAHLLVHEVGGGVQVELHVGAAHGVALRERGGAVGQSIAAAERLGSRVQAAPFFEVSGRLREQRASCAAAVAAQASLPSCNIAGLRGVVIVLFMWLLEGLLNTLAMVF